MPEQSEANNHTSKINVSPVYHTIFFPLGGQKMDLFAPTREKNALFDPIVEKFNFLTKICEI